MYRGSKGIMKQREQAGSDMPEELSAQGQASNQEAQGERLARFLAHAGVASRRHAEELIAQGRVRVNGTTITAQGTRVQPGQDRIVVDGKEIQAKAPHTYLLLHKPAGYVSTVSDPEGRATVLDLLPPELRSLRLYPVGRLDRDTSGLLLLTNDGAFAQHLTHPRYEKEKHYEVQVKGIPTERTLQALRDGVTFTEDDGKHYTSSPARVRKLSSTEQSSWLTLTIHEGRKRQVRRMLQAVDHPVLQLRRVGLGPLTLRGVALGKCRHLTPAEIQALLR
ncbi:pseudouridine synthase [Ktedonobacter sp. SOSP1-85]|uniref:pseudouridine synthase n=1 Tax=Ktedonobacter sp. SOSP1-85 TaxID=2778367 RepID=UPI001A25D22F|nr:pseudouridine synthase [Ktedonobacter sp. SOSP1-85]GHO75541.1 pseudouridine synthase [Ktedonobacter sp. SOSP1-85]